MSFDFYGTFTLGQWEVFRAFTAAQKVDIDARIKWLKREWFKVGKFKTLHDDDGNPTSYSATPPGSYAAKLIEAYTILGGVLERDMLLRTLNKPVFLKRRANTSAAGGVDTVGYSKEFSNGRFLRGDQRFDRDVGLHVESLKAWQLEAIKSKRERLEYKIKRALDYSDQIGREIILLESLLEEDGGLEDRIREMDVFITDPQRMNFTASADRHGLKIGTISDPSTVDVGREVLADHNRTPQGPSGPQGPQRGT